MKILLLHRSLNTGLMHFTQDRNATYGIKLNSRLGIVVQHDFKRLAI